MVMAAAEGCFCQRPIRLLKRRATELGGPDDESFLQQTARLQVQDEGRDAADRCAPRWCGGS